MSRLKKTANIQYNVHAIVNKLYRTIPLVPIGNLTQNIAQDIQTGLYNGCGDPNTNWQAWMDRCKKILSERGIIDVMDNRGFIDATPISSSDCGHIKGASLIRKADNMKRVFLGGTCNESTWRDDLIKLLEIDYFDPRVDDWNEEAQKKEVYEREHDDFCLYTITPKMTGVYSIAEAVDDSNKRPEKTIFCFLKEDEDKKFNEGQIRSLTQVSKMIEENGGKCFTDLQDVAQYLNKQ